MPSRRKGREFALQMLYQWEMSGGSPQEVQQLFWDRHPYDRDTRAFADLLFSDAANALDQIDGLISRHCRHWQLKRLAAVDRNLLRLATAELKRGETPAAVVIDEAIEIARKFGGSESGDFVNGVLDSIRKQLEATE